MKTSETTWWGSVALLGRCKVPTGLLCFLAGVIVMLLAGCQQQSTKQVEVGMTYEEVIRLYPCDEKLIRTGREYGDGPTEEQKLLDVAFELNYIEQHGFSVGFNQDMRVVRIIWVESATAEDLQ